MMITLTEAFKQAEANARLEGADPSGDPHYEDIKSRMVDGKLTADEARAEILAFHINH